MSLMGNICKNVLFQGLRRIFGVSAAKFAVVALALLVGAGCNLQVRQVERAGLRKIPAVIVETVQSEDPQATSSKEVVSIEGAGADDVAEAHIAEQGIQGESAGAKDELKASEPEQVLPDEGEVKEDSPAEIETAPASIEESPAKFASLPLSSFRLKLSAIRDDDVGSRDDEVGLQDSDVGARPVLASLTTPVGEAEVSSLPSAEGPADEELEAASTTTEPSPEPEGNGESRDLSDSPAEQAEEEIGASSVIEEPLPGPEEGGEGKPTAPALAAVTGDIRAEIEAAEEIPARTESEPGAAVLVSAVTAGAPQENQAEKSQDEAATGKPAAEKPAGRAGEEGSAPEAEAEEGGAEDDGGGDATAEPPAFPKGYLIVLVVCLALAVFKHTVGKI